MLILTSYLELENDRWTVETSFINFYYQVNKRTTKTYLQFISIKEIFSSTFCFKEIIIIIIIQSKKKA